RATQFGPSRWRFSPAPPRTSTTRREPRSSTSCSFRTPARCASPAGRRRSAPPTVSWACSPNASAASTTPTPTTSGPSPSSARSAFVGREPELERLVGAWDTAKAGGGRMVLVAGEPGIGKTRLAAQLAARVHTDGATVLFGRCDEDLGVPYQSLAEALRAYVA